MTNHHFLQRTPWHVANSRSHRPVSFAIATTLFLSSGLAVGSSLSTEAIASTQTQGSNSALEPWPTSLFDVIPTDRLSQNSEDIDLDDTSVDTPDDDIDSPTEASTSFNDRRFTCQYDDGEFVVMYSPESDPDDYFPWAIPGEMGGGWTPERRCNTISDRLEAYRPDGLLELTTDVENGYNTVCATTNVDPDCRIVFTVPEGQDPLETRDLVFENLAVANSGQDTFGVRTFQSADPTGNILEQLGSELGLNLPPLPTSSPSISSSRRSSSIDLRPFLDPADGGTGTAL